MSRIGRMPIAIPAGTTVTVADENVVTVTGKLGTLTEKFSSRMTIAVEGNQVIVTRPTDEKEDKSVHGLTRALLNNMVVGVTTGFSKKLEIVGVGYKVDGGNHRSGRKKGTQAEAGPVEMPQPVPAKSRHGPDPRKQPQTANHPSRTAQRTQESCDYS